MNLFEFCEQEAINYFNQEYGWDLSTKKERLALSPEDKKIVFDFLVSRFMKHQFGI